MKLFGWQFVRCDALSVQIGERVRDEMRFESTKIQNDLIQLRLNNDRLVESVRTLTVERDRYKAQVRVQTEADIVMASLRIITKAVIGEPRSPDLEREQSTLQAQMAAMRNCSPVSGGLIGGSGLGGLAAL